MTKRILECTGVLGSALALAFMPLAASAATPAVATAPAPVASSAPAGTPAAAGAAGKAASKNVMLYLDVFYAALHSDKVDHAVKERLVGCLYDNSLHKITDAMDSTIAKNADKVHLDNPSQVLDVMALICGYKPKDAKAPAKAISGMKGR